MRLALTPPRSRFIKASSRHIDTSNMNRKSDGDIEMPEDPSGLLSLKTGVDDTHTILLQERGVSKVQADEGSDTAPQRPKDYTFLGRHVEMIAIGIFNIPIPC